MGVAIITSTTPAWAWTNTGGQTVITAEGIGGGGGGGGENGYPCGGGGGKGGGYAKVVITKSAESTLNITIGAAGTAGSGGNGGDGGATTIMQGAATVLSAPGGGGGGGTTTNDHSGAAGTTENGAWAGTTQNAGGNGAAGLYTTPYSGGGGGAGGPDGAGGAASGITAGIAGAGAFINTVLYSGAGANGISGSESNGAAPSSNYGGGGSGACTTDNTNHTGGAGKIGIVVLTWQPATESDRIGATETRSVSAAVRPAETMSRAFTDSAVVAVAIPVSADTGRVGQAESWSALATLTAGADGVVGLSDAGAVEDVTPVEELVEKTSNDVPVAGLEDAALLAALLAGGADESAAGLTDGGPTGPPIIGLSGAE